MRAFVAGATGAIGKQLLPRLSAAGHEVHAITRGESKQAVLAELGVVAVVTDTLAPDQGSTTQLPDGGGVRTQGRRNDRRASRLDSSPPAGRRAAEQVISHLSERP
jgi:uncharacterized protein YbjT (DUF2867 family)